MNFFTGQGSDENVMLFLSDGSPNSGGPYVDEVAELEALNVFREADGFGPGCNVAALNDIDSDGDAQCVTQASELDGVIDLSPLFQSDLISFQLLQDGNLVADENSAGFVDNLDGTWAFTGELTGLDNSASASNTIDAIAHYDTNNNGAIDTTLTTTTDIDSWFV